MLKLTPAAEPYWLDLLPGVRVHVRPATVAAIIVARSEAAKVYRADPEDADTQTIGKATAAMVGALARFAIMAWEGVGDEADQPASVTPETVEALMRLWPAYDGFDRLYAGPALAGDTEKNG